MFAAVSQDDLREVVGVLMTNAKEGQPWAVKLALEYLLGPAADTALEMRLSLMEAALAAGGDTAIVVQQFNQS